MEVAEMSKKSTGNWDVYRWSVILISLAAVCAFFVCWSIDRDSRYRRTAQEVFATFVRTVTFVDSDRIYICVIRDGAKRTETWENEDTHVFQKFDSDEILTELETIGPGHRFKFIIAGWPDDESFINKNIISCEPAD